MYKLMLLVICGNYNGLIHSFLRDRDQKDVFNGQSWNCSHIKVGASRGLILKPLLFLVFINDLPEGLTTSANIFADDTLFYSVAHDSAASSVSLNYDLLKISCWITSGRWCLSQMPQKSRKRLFSLAKQVQLFPFNNVPVIRWKYLKASSL